MHQADRERTPAKTVFVRVGTASVWNLFVGVTVSVDVSPAVAMPVFMKVDTIAPKPPQHIEAEPHQHNADCRLEWTCQVFRDGVPKKNGGASEREQRQRVPKTPRQSMLDDIAHAISAGSDARYRRNMIGLQRVLNSKQKAESQNSKHQVPDFTGS